MKRLLKPLKIIIPITIGILFVLYAYQKFTPNQLNEIKNYFIKADYFYLLLSLSLAFLSHISRAFRWNYMLYPMGYKIKKLNSVMAIFLAYFMNMFIPRSGEVSRALVIQKYHKIPFQKLMGTIITERLVDFIILIFLVFISLIIQFDIIQNFIFSKIKMTELIKTSVIVIGVGILLTIILKRSNHPIIQKIKNFINGFKEGVSSLFKMKRKRILYYSLHTIFIWTMYILMFYVTIFALPETSNINTSAIITTFIVGGFAIAFTNGGFGAYPFLVAEMLLLYGIPETVGTAFGWIVWITQFIFLTFFGLLAMICLPIFNRKLNLVANET